jgi:hypothetical protein
VLLRKRPSYHYLLPPTSLDLCNVHLNIDYLTSSCSYKLSKSNYRVRLQIIDSSRFLGYNRSTLDPPNQQASEPRLRFKMPDLPSAPAPLAPLDPRSDSDILKTTGTGHEYILDGVRWHTLDRKRFDYAPPRPEDLPCPPTSLVDPHCLSGAVPTNGKATGRSARVQRARAYPMGPVKALRGISESASSDIMQPSTPSERPATASFILSSRELERQIEQYGTQLQEAARPEDQKTILEEIMRNEAPTPQAVKQHYRRIAASFIERERVRDGLESKRGREGMLFGSELVESRGREERRGDDREGVGGRQRQE